MRHIPRKTLAIAVVALLLTPLLAVAGGAWRDKTDALRDSINGGHADNVILLIGDGMGVYSTAISPVWGLK